MQKSPKLLKMPRKAGGRATAGSALPIYVPPVAAAANRHHRRMALNKCIHIIPIVVLLCLFILWWFSYPVDLEVKDGRFTVIPKVEKPISLNETRINLAFLAAAATPPYASTSHILIVENQTAAEPPGGTD